jgi:predicted lipid-binding transport protein (Tim44 family)
MLLLKHHRLTSQPPRFFALSKKHSPSPGVGWLAGWLGGLVAGWLLGWLVGWLAGLAGW